MEQINFMLYFGAVALGALHAFEPGHGKTIISAYMLGSRGRVIDGVVLGLVATVTHTFSVVVLGIIATVLSTSYSEAQLHAWLGLFSALLILIVGLWMLRQRLSGHAHHHHLSGHGHGHDHHHHPHPPHDHAHPADQTGGNSRSQQHGAWKLMLLGVSGGLVPCPAGIATLLAAIAAGRVAQGLIVAIFFSLGLGLVMMSIGVTMALAGGHINRRFDKYPDFSHRLGVVSALIIIMLGSYTLYHSLSGII